MPSSFLLEIGVEELPARFCALALAQIEERGAGLLREARLGFVRCRALGSPRRVAWAVEGLAKRQEDVETVARGPARAAAFDADGRPTRAAQGFARAQGVDVGDLVLEAAGGKEYVFARHREPGRPAAEVLAELCPRLIGSLDFPRKMRWGSGDFRFPRPVRWLVALLDAEVIPFAIEGLASGRLTYGHRTLHPQAVELARPQEYVETLRRAGVLVDVEERREAVRRGVAAAVAQLGGRPREHPGLLDEVTDLLEWPTPFVGRFDPAALRVPEDVLVTVMRVHQRYFPVEGADGRLMPFFAGVRNGGEACLANVAAGNEKVLAARFADARFFYDEDRRAPLESRLPRLGTVAFADGLGSLADKTGRLIRLASWIGARVGADVAVVARAAELAKADRLTHLVSELPELEGAMGAHYAEADGERAEVVAAVAEHVLPRAPGDALPETAPGRALALADRLDTLAGQFMRGRQPSGSADPLGLRRAGAAAVRILEDAGWDLRLSEAVLAASSGYPEGTGSAAGLPEFLVGRLRARLEEAGFRYDIADAVLAAGPDRVADAFARCRALAAALQAPDWPDVATVWRRAANLARQGQGPTARPELMREPTERALVHALGEARRRADQALAERDFAAVLAATAALRRPVDEFLTAVLVMDPDPELRAARLALLAAVAALPSPVADLSRLSGAG